MKKSALTVLCMLPLLVGVQGASAENIYPDPLPPVPLDTPLIAKAGLLVYRPAGELAIGRLAKVSVDGVELTRLAEGSYVFVCLQPGQRTIAGTLSDAYSGEAQVFNAAAGWMAYFEIPPNNFYPSIRKADAQTAELAIKGLAAVGVATNRDAVGRNYHDTQHALPRSLADCK